MSSEKYCSLLPLQCNVIGNLFELEAPLYICRNAICRKSSNLLCYRGTQRLFPAKYIENSFQGISATLTFSAVIAIKVAFVAKHVAFCRVYVKIQTARVTKTAYKITFTAGAQTLNTFQIMVIGHRNSLSQLILSWLWTTGIRHGPFFSYRLFIASKLMSFFLLIFVQLTSKNWLFHLMQKFE